MTLLRLGNLVLAFIALIPSILLFRHLLYERNKLKRSLTLLNAVLLLLVFLIGLRSIIQTGTYLAIVLGWIPNLHLLNSMTLTINVLSATGSWLFWYYVHNVNKS